MSICLYCLIHQANACHLILIRGRAEVSELEMIKKLKSLKPTRREPLPFGAMSRT